MNVRPEKAIELQSLLGQLCNDDLPAAGFERLSQLLAGDVEAQKLYVHYLDLHQSLRQMAVTLDDQHLLADLQSKLTELRALTEVTEPLRSADEMESGRDRKPALPAPLPLSTDDAGGLLPERSEFHLPSFLSGGLLSWYAFGLLLISVTIGIVVAEGWLLYRSRPDGAVADASRSVAAPGAITPVAYLTSTNGCAWGGDSLQTWTVGHSVESGSEVSLHEGVAEFRLASGVSLGIEGPALMLLVSPSKIVLQYGKVTAHVPWGSDGLKVATAGCRMEARDAEFGVSLTGNKLDVHVFSGEVAAASSIASAEYDSEEFVVDNSYFTDALITAGRALRLMAQGEVLRVVGWQKAAPDQFVAKLSMSGPLVVTQEYVDQVKAAGPISYWRFEEVVDAGIPNEIDPGLPLLIKEQAVLVGGKGNQAAEFQWNDFWYLATDKPLPLAKSDYSIEVWVKPSHLHLGNMVSLRHPRAHYSAIRLELQGGTGENYIGNTPGALRYVHRVDNSEHKFGTSCFSSTLYGIRRWQHVVAVKSKTHMRLYLDGKLSASTEESLPLQEDLHVRVGLANPRGPHVRKFIGQLDELAIYDRALSEKEIARHYKKARQATETPKPKNVARVQPKEV